MLDAVYEPAVVDQETRYIERALSADLDAVVATVAEGEICDRHVVRGNHENICQGGLRPFIPSPNDDRVAVSRGAADHEAWAKDFKCWRIQPIGSVDEEEGGRGLPIVGGIQGRFQLGDGGDLADLTAAEAQRRPGSRFRRTRNRGRKQ